MIRRGTDKKFATELFVRGPSKKAWTEQEDEILRQLTAVHGTGNWTLIAQSLPDRTGKQCRERFHNHLDTGIKKGDWTEQEDRIILILQKALGNQWAKITKLLPGRTDNAVKNRFHALERAKGRGRLDESVLQDPAFSDFILKEAMRLNNDNLEALSAHDSVCSMDSSSLTYDSRSRSTSTATSTGPTAYPPSTEAVHSLMMDSDGGQEPVSPFLQKARWISPPSHISAPHPMHPHPMSSSHGGHNGVGHSAHMSHYPPEEDADDDSVANSADGLMDLDIISFEGDDTYYQLSDHEGDGSRGPTPAAGGGRNGGDVDPRCFSFEWSCIRGIGQGAGSGNGAGHAAGDGMHGGSSGGGGGGGGGGMGYGSAYLCGLDAPWSFSHGNHQSQQPHHPPPGGHGSHPSVQGAPNPFAASSSQYPQTTGYPAQAPPLYASSNYPTHTPPTMMTPQQQPVPQRPAPPQTQNSGGWFFNRIR